MNLMKDIMHNILMTINVITFVRMMHIILYMTGFTSPIPAFLTFADFRIVLINIAYDVQRVTKDTLFMMKYEEEMSLDIEDPMTMQTVFDIRLFS